MSQTKDRVLTQALPLFAHRGYQATSMEDIAQAVGIKAPSLYKHFKGKQEIFDALLAQLDEPEDALQAALTQAETQARSAGSVSETLLLALSDALMAHALDHPTRSQLRRLLALERFRDPALAQRYQALWVDRPTALYQSLFAALSQLGLLRRGDSRAMAAQFVAPICLQISRCDVQPDARAQAAQELRQHVHLFYRAFAVRSAAPPSQGSLGRLWRR